MKGLAKRHDTDDRREYDRGLAKRGDGGDRGLCHRPDDDCIAQKGSEATDKAATPALRKGDNCWAPADTKDDRRIGERRERVRP